MDWVAFAESRTAAFLFTSLQFVACVIGGTIALSLLSIWLIESMEGVARRAKTWLKRPNLWA